MSTQDRRTNPMPRTLALFEKRIDGDDSLLELARLRFRQAGMGAEMHATTPEQLEWLLKFRPSEDSSVVLHLPREFNLTDGMTRSRILDFATRFAGRVYGMVLHDHAALGSRVEDYRRAASELGERLGKIPRRPRLFIEYAAGLELEKFVGFFESIRNEEHISACIDIGHVGIRQARNAYARLHPGEDICGLKSQPSRLPQLMGEVEAAVAAGAAAAIEVVAAIGASGKPLHFHLHDGHPLSTFSPFGVSDHVSFLAEIPLNFEHRGRRAAGLMFGPGGLGRVVSKAAESPGSDALSFTLEIHPTSERLRLGDAVSLFGHWTDKTNAEKMNHWLSILTQNHSLLRERLPSRTAYEIAHAAL